MLDLDGLCLRLGVHRGIFAGLSTDDRRRLGTLLIEHLQDIEALVEEAPLAKETHATGAYEVRIGRSDWHLRTAAISRDEATAFVKVATLLLLGTGKPSSLAAAAVAAAAERLRHTDVRGGETSVMETLIDARVALGPDEIAAQLASGACRHPGKRCDFEVSGQCSITTEAAQHVVEELAGKKLVRRSYRGVEAVYQPEV
jgi:hypothetical protein